MRLRFFAVSPSSGRRHTRLPDQRQRSSITANRVPPQGIESSHIEPVRWHYFINPVAVLGIAIFLGLPLAGMFGGQPHPTQIIETPSATLTLQFPEILRNGEFFEMRATVKAKRPVTDLNIGISASYFYDLTVNTMFPAPSKEKSEGGLYVLSYGALKTGDTLNLKFDGQINPPMFAGTEGKLVLADGDTTVATIPLKLRVFP